jgi:hypothetical protein
MGKLSACIVEFTVEASEPIRLGSYPGSPLRGALLESLLQRFCMNPSATDCLACPLRETCPVSGFIAPLRGEHARGQDPPRPFVLDISSLVPVGMVADQGAGNVSERLLQPGERFCFSLTLLGTAIKFFPYVSLSVPALEALGLGGKLQRLGGRRGRVRVLQMEAVDPFTGTREQLYARGQLEVKLPSVIITVEDVMKRAAQLPADNLTLHFLTPTRLIGDGRLLRQPLFRPLALRLAERLGELAEGYGEEDDLSRENAREQSFERYTRFETLSRQVQLVAQQTTWVELASYSSRRERTSPISGFIGNATYAGDLTELRELLVWGEVFHVGKNTVKGDGRYQIMAGESKILKGTIE